MDNIDYVNKDVVSLWQKIIRHGDQPTEINTDMNYDQHRFNPSGHSNSSMRIIKPIIDKIEMSEKHLTEVEYSRLSKNPQAIILYDIIQDWLFLNPLQRVIVKKVLSYAILSKGNQYYHRSKQILLYVRGKRGVGKIRILKAIHLRFSFLKR